MKLKEVMKLLHALPKPDDMKEHMPGLNSKAMLQLLLNDEHKKLANLTLIGILVGTINKVIADTPDYEDYVAVKSINGDSEGIEAEVPEPCGDPECEGCAELEKAMAHAKANGGEIKAVRLTKKQAMEMGLIDADGNDINPGVAGHCKDEDEDSSGKVIH